MSPVRARLLAGCVQSGIILAEDHRDDILGALDSVENAWQDKIVTAIVSNMPSGGVKSIEWGPIKGALLASETQMDQATNDAIANAFDRIIATLKKASA